jgi:acyl-coenzyme A thioesterase PaaI-like protein
MTGIADRRAAAARLGAALRDLATACVLSEVPAAELDAVAEQARALTARLAATARPADRLSSIDDLSAGIRMYNPVNGEASPFAPPLRFDDDPAQVSGRVVLGPGFEGHAGYAHGGATAMLFDDVLGVAVSRRIWPTVTRQLAVRYLRPVPVSEPLLITATVTGFEDGRMTVQGTLSTEASPGTALATAEGVFVALRPEQAQALLGTDLRRAGAPPSAAGPS